jgi:hypothetical protein
MTHLETLKIDLDIHTKSREALKDGTGGYFIKRAGYSVDPIICSYDDIIRSLEKEIVTIEAKKGKKKTHS